MNSVNDVFIFHVTGSDVADFALRGGVYMVTLAAGSWGTVTLKVLAADGTTYVPFQTWSANAAATLTLVAGQYQFAYSSVSAATLGMAQQPPTPNWRLQSLTQPLPINADGGATNYQTLTGFDSITVSTPNASGDTGSLSLSTGTSSGSDSGDITVVTGSADGTRGSLQLDTGTVVGTNGFTVITPDNGSGDSQPMVLQTGTATGTRGSITLDGHVVILSNLPTSASGLPSGAVWNSSGTLHVA